MSSRGFVKINNTNRTQFHSYLSPKEINSFDIDQDIKEKSDEFDRYRDKVVDMMSKEFDSAMNEYRRQHRERETNHRIQVKDLEAIRTGVNDLYKGNSRESQRLRKQTTLPIDSRLRELMNGKETLRARVNYNKSIFKSIANFFEVEFITRPDYTKKIKPIRKYCQGGDRTVLGCDSSDKKIFLADCYNNQVLVADKTTGQPLKPIGGGHISRPWGIKSHKGTLYVSEPENGRVSVFNNNGDFRYSRRLDHRGSDPKLCDSKPGGMDVDKNGRMYIADSGKKVIHVVDSNTRALYSIAEIRESLVCPQDVKVVGERVFVLDSDAMLVKVFDREGNYIKSLIPSYQKQKPEFFAVDAHENILICNQKSGFVQIYDSQGNFMHQIACADLGGIAVNHKGEITVACMGEELCYIF